MRTRDAGCHSTEGNHSGAETDRCHSCHTEEEVKRRGIETPAIIVVGKVCDLADKFAWYEKLPLAGYKVLVTRPRET